VLPSISELFKRRLPFRICCRGRDSAEFSKPVGRIDGATAPLRSLVVWRHRFGTEAAFHVRNKESIYLLTQKPEISLDRDSLRCDLSIAERQESWKRGPSIRGNRPRAAACPNADRLSLDPKRSSTMLSIVLPEHGSTICRWFPRGDQFDLRGIALAWGPWFEAGRRPSFLVWCLSSLPLRRTSQLVSTIAEKIQIHPDKACGSQTMWSFQSKAR
jgi:hypothetical protein